MNSKDIEVGQLVRVNHRINHFVNFWVGRVKDHPAGGTVKIQRVSVIDDRDIGDVIYAPTRTVFAKARTPSIYDEERRQEQQEAVNRPRYIRLCKALGDHGISPRRDPHRPDFIFEPETYDALLRILEKPVQQPGVTITKKQHAFYLAAEAVCAAEAANADPSSAASAAIAATMFMAYDEVVKERAEMMKAAATASRT